MVDAVGVPPVPDAAVGAHLFQGHGFLGSAQGDYQEDLISWRDSQQLPQPVPLDGAEHAAAQPLGPGSQEDGLGRDAVVAAEVFGDFRVAQDDDIGGGVLACRRPRPVLQVAGPGQAGENGGVFLRLAGQEVFQGLEVGGGGAPAGQVDQSMTT